MTVDAYTPGRSICGNCGRRADGADLCAMCARASEPAKRICCPGCGQWWGIEELIAVGDGMECPRCGEVPSQVTVADSGLR
jgi:hypothetical protein